MKKMNRLTQEALSVLKAIYEDQVEDRFAYRNEVHRLTASGLTCSFGSLEHFLDRYGYVSIDQRHDALLLTSSGLEAIHGESQKMKSLNDDIQYHFAKEIADGILKETIAVNTGKRFDQHFIRFEGIGRGGVGSVWRAEHLKTGRSVAIKTLEGIDEVITSGRKSTLKKRLERKIRQLAQLSHPFICPILDLSVHHTPPYYVMPLFTGGSLRDALAHGPLQPEVALNLFSQICMGIQHAHGKDVLHLDLKPENILLDERGNVRLFDFGMSRTIAKQVAQVGRQSYIGFGSVAYMAPELLRDPQAEAASIDIYALGLILYEMLIGELPGRRSPMPSDVIEGLPLPIDDLFDAMTQDSVTQRPKSMMEVLKTLNQVPPFDRLSSQSMVMTFIESPFQLPGLNHLEIPEFEESTDIQKESRSSAREELKLETSRSKSDQILSAEPPPKSRPADSSHQVPPSVELSHTSTPAEEVLLKDLNALTEATQSHPTDLLSDEDMKTTDTGRPSPLVDNYHKSQNMAGHSDQTVDPYLSSSTPIIDISEISEADVKMIEDSLEVLEDLDELEDEEPMLMSSMPKTALSYTTERNKERDSLVQEVEERLTDQVFDDDFMEDEATALHDSSPVDEKPHLSQPQLSSAPRRTSSVAQQLFERHSKDNPFKP
jgi:serine/threonine protein kinase